LGNVGGININYACNHACLDENHGCNHACLDENHACNQLCLWNKYQSLLQFQQVLALHSGISNRGRQIVGFKHHFSSTDSIQVFTNINMILNIIHLEHYKFITEVLSD
jgi:hypothetical protein